MSGWDILAWLLVIAGAVAVLLAVCLSLVLVA